MIDPNQILAAIPDGGSVTFAVFAAKVGSIANFLNFASPNSLSRSGSHLTIDCKGGSVTSGGVTIKTAPAITTDIAIGANDVITLSNVKGITISESIASGSLKTAVITPLANGNFTIQATVDVGILGDITVTKTVDPQGQVV